MNFRLVLPEERNLVKFKITEEDSLAYAIYKVYKKDTSLNIVWEEYIIKMDYMSHVSDCISDIYYMVESVFNKENYYEMQFFSQSFFELWIITRNNDKLRIEWRNRELYPIIEVNASHFINEWLNLLIQIKEDLTKAGFSCSNVEDFYLLDNLERFRS